MKVGDRIRVFEVSENGSDYYGKDFLGKQSGEVYGEFFGNENGVDLNLAINENENIHVGIDKERNHAKQVFTMVITKLK